MIAINPNSRNEVFIIDPNVRVVYDKSVPPVKSRGEFLTPGGCDSPDSCIEPSDEKLPSQRESQDAD